MKKLLALVASFFVALSFSFPFFADGTGSADGTLIQPTTWIDGVQPLPNYGFYAQYNTGTWYYADFGWYYPGDPGNRPGSFHYTPSGSIAGNVFINRYLICFGFIPFWNYDGDQHYGWMNSTSPTVTSGNSAVQVTGFSVNTNTVYAYSLTGQSVLSWQYVAAQGVMNGVLVDNTSVDSSSRFRPQFLDYFVYDTLWLPGSSSSSVVSNPDGYKVIAFIMFFDDDASNDDIIAAIDNANTDINQGLDDFQQAIDGWGSGAVNPGANSSITSADSALGDLNTSEDVYWDQINTQIDDLDFSITDISALSAGLTYIGNIFMMIWNTDLRTPIVLSLMLGLVLLVIGRGVRFQAAARRSERRERNNRTGGDP